MTSLRPHLDGRILAVAVAVLLLTGTFYLFTGRGPETKEVAAHFPRAVSVYPGTDVRILGVNVGRVTAVVPEGNSVRVEMEYDAQYKVPADAQAVIVTPTLVADRFVQLTPAWTEGKVMADGADIPLPDTAVPVELDRIYASLRDLSVALGRNGVNEDGTLDHLLTATARAMKGNGARGNQMLTDLAGMTGTLGKGSENLFATVDELASFTTVLARNDRTVRAFISDLAGMSDALVTERAELQRAVAAVARAVGSVEGFVRDNRKALVTDVEKLTKVMTTINSQRRSIDQALHAAPLALGNLTVAFDTKSGSIGSRIGLQGTTGNPALLLCAIVQQSDIPDAHKDLACRIFDRLFKPYVENQPSQDPSNPLPAARVQLSNADPSSVRVGDQYASSGNGDFASLVGGGR